MTPPIERTLQFMFGHLPTLFYSLHSTYRQYFADLTLDLFTFFLVPEPDKYWVVSSTSHVCYGQKFKFVSSAVYGEVVTRIFKIRPSTVLHDEYFLKNLHVIYFTCMIVSDFRTSHRVTMLT